MIRVIDSHTEGEPTRVVVEGFPELAGRTMAERRDAFRIHHDDLRRKIVLEPRGYDAVVGALLTPPVNEGSTAGVIFFNDVGYLGMCGHGTIGVFRTLEHLGRAGDEVVLDTSVGTVRASKKGGEVEIENVVSRAFQLDVKVGDRAGDIAYGGNWFFLTESRTPIEMKNLNGLMSEALTLRALLRKEGITGEQGAEIDHVELFRDGKVFVLCPGSAWDRSPCGTGTSAKMACLAARGKLAPHETWTQESIVGGRFYGHYEAANAGIRPFIRGRAFLTAESQLLFEAGDFLP